MNIKKIKKILKAIKNADCIVIGNSPLLKVLKGNIKVDKVDFSNVVSILYTNDNPQNDVLWIEWYEWDGEHFISFTESDLDKAYICKNGNISLTDKEGNETFIKLYKLKQVALTSLK